MLVFLYGTLLDPGVLAARSGRRGLERAGRPAWLPGWCRVALRGAPYPTLLRARRGGVAGMVARLRGGVLRRLMAYEGAAYRLRPLRVLTRSGRLAAAAWIAAPALADPLRPWTPAGQAARAAREIVRGPFSARWLAPALLSRAW